MSTAVIERALIHVAGPARSGKTAFIEAMLAGSDALVLAARCVQDLRCASFAKQRRGAIPSFVATARPGR